VTGEIAERDIHAPIAFSAPYLEQDVEMLQLQRVLVVPPVVRRLAAPRENALRRVEAWRAAFRSHAAMTGVSLEERVGLLALRFPELGSEDIIRALTTVRPDSFFAVAVAALDVVFGAGVVDFLPPGNYRDVSIVTGDAEAEVDTSALTLQGDLGERLRDLLLAQGLAASDAEWGAQLVRPLVSPNLVYQDEETRARRVSARQEVPTLREFLQGERVVERGVRVTEQDALYLESLLERLVALGDVGEGEGMFWRQQARLLFAACLLGLFGWVAILYFVDLLRENRNLLSAAAAFALFLVAAAFCLHHPSLGPFAVPVPLLSVLVTVLYRDRVGFPLTILAISWLAFHMGVAPFWLLVWLVSGLVSVALMRRIRQRDQFYRAIAILAGIQIAMISLSRLADGTGASGLLQEYLVGIITPVASVALALFLLPIVEPLVGACSDLTLLELSDLNHPLLKKMALESQGTFHHSQVVGQLAEHAAQGIGANSLLTRVGALFHDIGKMNKPEYYVENQGGGPNKHDDLSPSMSALVVASHVKEGMELARKWRLPERVIDFIPEHHGTHVMKFFYHKALESAGNETVKVDDFRYPGPKPRSRETAILMLADAVEAATRSLSKPTPGRIREIVKQIIDERMFNGELDECGLTLKDLATIRDSFVPLLVGIHHVRIAYPGQRERGRAPDAIVRERA
ncbi:HDIG domain-containing protein, partial [bacterium]|nr:HDIG domain-containing protein [bacterium]